MKLLFRIFLVLVLLFVLAIFGLNYFLDRQLAPAIRAVLPQAEEKLGVSLELGDASIKLFQGSMEIKDFKVGNPEGFKSPHFFTLERSFQKINLGALLFRREIRIDEVTIENSDLTVVRNEKGDMNLLMILAALDTGEEPEPEDVPEEDEPKEPSPLPPFQLEKLYVSSLLTYLTENEKGDSSYSFQIKINGHEIGTIGEEDHRGTLSIQGNLAGQQDLFVMRADASIAPITNPMEATFELTGKVDSVDLKMFDVFQKDFHLRGGMMGLDLVIHCENGIIDDQRSTVGVLIAQPDLGDSLPIPPGFAPASLRFPVRIGGTLENPEIFFMEGLRKGIRDAVAGVSPISKEDLQEAADQLKGQATEAIDDLKKDAEGKVDQLKKEADKSLQDAKSGLKERSLPDLDRRSKSEGGLGILPGIPGSKPSDEKEESAEEEETPKEKGNPLENAGRSLFGR